MLMPQKVVHTFKKMYLLTKIIIIGIIGAPRVVRTADWDIVSAVNRAEMTEQVYPLCTRKWKL